MKTYFSFLLNIFFLLCVPLHSQTKAELRIYNPEDTTVYLISSDELSSLIINSQATKTGNKQLKTTKKAPWKPGDEEIIDLPAASLFSPYHTICSFLYFQQKEYYKPDEFIKTLNMPSATKKEKIKRAVELKEYLDGAGYYIKLYDITDNPDYVDSSSGRSSYEFVENHPQIYLTKIGEDWVISKATAKSVPELHDQMYPYGTIEWIPEKMRTNVWGLETWQWLGILIYVVAGLLLGKFIMVFMRFLFSRLLKEFGRGNAEKRLFHSLSRPTAFFIVMVLYGFFLPALRIPIEINQYIMKGIKLAAPLFLMVVLYYLVDLVAHYIRSAASKTQTKMDDQLLPVVKKIFKAIIIVVGIVIVLKGLNVNVTTLLAGLSIGGLALALAAQETVKNLIGSMMIFLDKPFQIGDFIEVNGYTGTIEEVGVRSTRLRTMNNSLVSIPNGELINHEIDNLGVRVMRRMKLDIALTYDASPEKIEEYVEGLRKIVLEHEKTNKDSFEIHFNGMGDFSLNILFHIYFNVTSWTEELNSRQEILLSIMKLAEKVGVEFAFPTQSLILENANPKPTLG